MKWENVKRLWESPTTTATQSAARSPRSSQARAARVATASAPNVAEAKRPARAAAWRSASAPVRRASPRVAFMRRSGCLKLSGRSPVTCSTLLGSSEW
jgi:hypothetical protein